MSVAAATPLSVALAHARKGRAVAPGCPPDANGDCTCGGTWDKKLGQLVPHKPKEVGKAPIGTLVRNGISDATTNTATIDRWWRANPRANVNVELEAAGWVVVDTDSPQVEADALSRGLDGAVIRESRNRAYVFTRPADCPVVNLIKADGDPLDILTLRNFVVHGTHQTGCPVRLDPEATPGPAPAWVVDLLTRKHAADQARKTASESRRAERSALWGGGAEPPVRLHRRGRERWNGELVQLADGHVDRDLSLFYLGLDLAERNASEPTIVGALAERDAALGWNKFTDRADDREYVKIAEKAVARAVERERERTPRVQLVDDPKATSDDPAELRAALEAATAEVGRLRRALMDRDDRLEVLEPIVTAIDEILARPEVETDRDGNVVGGGLTSDDKVVAIGLARWLPHYREKKANKGESENVSLGYLSKVLGMPGRRISKSIDRQSSKVAADGAAFRKVRKPELAKDREGNPIFDKNGRQVYTTPIEVIPWGDSATATLRRAATYATPILPKRGGSQAASDARWGRCDKHDNRDVLIKGHCPDCGKVVGERSMTLAEFDALNVQVGHSEDGTPTVSKGYLIGVQLGHSDGRDALNLQPVHSDPRIEVDELADRRAAAIMAVPMGRPVDAWKQPGEPISDSHERASLGPLMVKPSWRCGCGSYERSTGVEGQERCDGCAAPVGPTPGVPGGGAVGELIAGADPGNGDRDIDAVTWRSCCGTAGPVHRRAGAWTCTGCGSELAS